MRESKDPFQSSYHSPRSKRLERQKRRRRRRLVIGCVLALILGIGGAFAVFLSNPNKETEETAAEEIVIENNVTVNGISMEGLSKSQALEAILKARPWSMTVVLEDQTYDIDDLSRKKTEELLDKICADNTQGEYTVDMSKLDEEIKAQAEECAKLWDLSPKNSVLESFDEESGKFLFSESSSGRAVDQEKLVQDIKEAVENGQFTAKIQAQVKEVPAEMDKAQAQEQYKTLASFVTDTTNNEKRNTNVRLSAEALNGTIVQPGEEFSFNKVVGQRTEEKGYQQAAAYNSGQVVQEVGGGVCQMSSTLYKVAFQSGMKITFRRSHTFEPNYVTPGQDATISWEEPDFRFVNTSSAPIGIKAGYSNRKASVSIYGIPVLEEGITWDLYSEKVAELDPPEPVYEEDQTLEPGVEKVKSSGSKGSKWVTYKVIYKDGKEIERVEDHSKTYKGHAPVILRNTSGVVLKPEETSPAETTPAPTVDGMPEDYVPGQSTEIPPEETLPEETESQEVPAPVPLPLPSETQTASTEAAGPGAGIQ